MTMRGVTLLETLLYLALFAFMLTGTFISLANMHESATRIDASARLTDEGNFLLHRLRYIVHAADSISVPARGEQQTRLILLLPTGSVSIRAQEGRLMYEQDGSLFPLTGSEITVSDLSFERESGTPGRPAALVISFTLFARTATGGVFSRTFTELVYPLNETL